MLHKAIVFVALSSFISFAGYADEPKNDDDQQLQVQWTVAKELAKCNCGKKNKSKNEEEPIIDEEETSLAACGKCQPPKLRENDKPVSVEEEEEVEEIAIA